MKYLWVVSEVIEENRLYKCRQYYVDGSGEIEIGASGDINDSSVRLKTDAGTYELRSSPLQDLDTRHTAQIVKEFIVDIIAGIVTRALAPLVQIAMRSAVREILPDVLNSASDTLSSALGNFVTNGTSEASNNQNGTVESNVQPGN